MMCNLPSKLMYKHIRIDSQHKIWIPRWGYSNKQIADTKKYAEELPNDIKWK